jgi:hypothetical protein
MLPYSLVRELSQILSELSLEADDTVNLISYFVEVGGMITGFDKLGVSRVSLQKGGTLEVDLTIPSAFHSGKEPNELRAVVFEVFALSIPKIVSRLKTAGSQQELLSAFVTQVTNALNKFLLNDSDPVFAGGDQAIHSGFIRLLEAQKLSQQAFGTDFHIALPKGWMVRVDPQNSTRVQFYRTQTESH